MEEKTIITMPEMRKFDALEELDAKSIAHNWQNVVRFLLSLKYSEEKQPKELGHREDWASIYKG